MRKTPLAEYNLKAGADDERDLEKLVDAALRDSQGLSARQAKLANSRAIR